MRSTEEPSPKVCHAEACAIQGIYNTAFVQAVRGIFDDAIDCLRRTNYNERRCTAAIDSLYACCKKMYEENREARAIACPQPEQLKLKLEQRAKEVVDAEMRKTRMG
ncbi:hypothetical protein V1523DRAFT_401767 [Lipomyces doorenjongii]